MIDGGILAPNSPPTLPLHEAIATAVFYSFVTIAFRVLLTLGKGGAFCGAATGWQAPFEFVSDIALLVILPIVGLFVIAFKNTAVAPRTVVLACLVPPVLFVFYELVRNPCLLRGR